MALFGFRKTAPASDTPRFVFADGATLSLEQYGYLAVRNGSNTAVLLVNECFGEGTIGAKLGLAKAIAKVRFAADIYTNMLEVAIYLWHAVGILRVNGEVVERISKGILDCLGDLRAPNGHPLDQDFKEFLLRQAYNFTTALEKDADEAATRSAGVFYPQPLPSSALWLDILHRSNSDDQTTVEAWNGGFNIWLRTTL
jgi:hypothetical protein